MPKQLESAWCSVLLTRADTSPNSVKEARVVGLPAVTFQHGGQAGYIIDCVNGRVLHSNQLSSTLCVEEPESSISTKMRDQYRRAFAPGRLTFIVETEAVQGAWAPWQVNM